MDRKSKKRLEVLQQKRSKLLTELGVVRRRPDDPAEIPVLEQQLAALEAEILKLKQE